MTEYELAVSWARQLEEEGVTYEELMQTLNEAIDSAIEEVRQEFVMKEQDEKTD